MKIGSLCTGYGGLDMAIGGETVWVSDIDKHARTLLAHRFPDVPNLGDLTAIDWETVEPVDIITAGYPCQPFSHAGKREGTNDARHIWPHIANAIRVLRPRYAFLENVAGHLSMGFGDVLGDLAEAGYDARWVCVRASDVGAPHRRERVFISATDAPRDPRRIFNGGGLSPTDAQGVGRRTGSGHHPAPGKPGRDTACGQPGDGPGADSAVTDSKVYEQRELADGGEVQAEPWDGSWGDYLPAITRWEHVTGRAAPAPTTTGTTGRAVLNPPFVEWMMGLPAGWVTDVPGISRTGQLHLLGNGVVPQQAQQALAILADQAVAA